MKTKKLLSLLLALMMMLSVVPMYASAADPIALTEANVTVWPTASGEIYFGQKISDGITLSGGEVQYDGVVVPGLFEFTDASFVPTSSGSQLGNITFIPEDSSAYQGFVVETAWDVVYQVKKTTPVLVDENNPPVATRVEEGAKLSTSTISGGLMKNPYNDSEPKVAAGEWEWTNRRTVVTESGYYEAEFYVKGYEGVTMMIYVGINGDIVETNVLENPSIPELYYDGVTTWNDIPLSGGIAVEKDTTNVVEGTFAITDSWKAKVIEAGTYEVDATFIPNDTEAYTKVDFKIPVTVNKAPIKFVDENGAEIVPEITVPYGTKFNDISRLLRPYVKGPEYVYFAMGDLSSQLCANGTYTVTATAPDDSEHYEDTELTFKIVVDPKVINPKAYSSTEGYYVYDNSGVYHVEGTFDFYIDGELYKSGVKYLEKVAYTPEKSGTHEIKFVYKPVENDNFAIENEITATVTVNLTHKLTSSDNVGTFGDFKNGTAIELAANIAAENFAGWKITDVNGNEVTLDGVDNSKTKITITMPDYDIHVEALEKNASEEEGPEIDLDFDTDGTHKFDFVNFIQNLIAKLKALIQQIGEFFSSGALSDIAGAVN